jgi:Flp pilus assembly protein TadB
VTLAPVLALVCALAGGLLFLELTQPSRPAERRRGQPGSVRRFLLAAGLERLSPAAFVGFSLACAVVGGLVAQASAGWPALSLLVAAGAGAVPWVYYWQRAARRRTAHQLAVLGLANQLRAALLKGQTIEQSLLGLSRLGPAVLRPALGELITTMRARGLPEALDEFSQRLADPIGDDLVRALRLVYQFGPDATPDVLRHLVDDSRQRLELEREARSRQSQQRWVASIATAFPVLLVPGLKWINPTFMAVYDQPGGQLVLGLCLLWALAWYLVALRLGRLPRLRRVTQG